VSDQPVRVILDTSAIVAFTRGSLDVGEVIAEVHDEYAVVGPPMLCLVEASSAVAGSDRRDLLVNHPATAVLAPYPDDWQALAAVYNTVGRLDAASTVLAAIDLGCQVLSSPACTVRGAGGRRTGHRILIYRGASEPNLTPSVALYSGQSSRIRSPSGPFSRACELFDPWTHKRDSEARNISTRRDRVPGCRSTWGARCGSRLVNAPHGDAVSWTGPGPPA
jgi:hypothetical protein